MEDTEKREPGLVQEQGIWYAQFKPERHVCIPDTTVFPFSEFNKVQQKTQTKYVCCFTASDFHRLLLLWNESSRSNGILSYVALT